MARPKTTELTERELELMHVFWEHGPLTAVDARIEEAWRTIGFWLESGLGFELSDKKRISQLENELKEYRQLVIALEKRIEQLEGRQPGTPLIVGEVSDQMRAMSQSPLEARPYNSYPDSPKS